jgi:hypothetical protein
MSEYQPANSQNQTLPERVHGTVSRLLENEDLFKELR